MDLVSICIPTYNGEQFIVEAMESAINQTYPNLEIVVSDDASNDTTLKLIEQFKEKTKIQISIYHHKPNGIGANWNNCIKRAKGKYIKFLFQDDILLPTCIEKLVDVLESDPRIGLVASKREFIVEDSHLNENTKAWIKKFSDLQVSLDLPLSNGMYILDASVLKSKNFFRDPRNMVGEPSAVLFTKNIVQKIGFFREDLKQILDYEFYNRVLKKYRIAILPKKTLKFRLHSNQATNLNRGKDNEDYTKYDEIVYKEFFWYLNWSNKKLFLKRHNSFIKTVFKYLKFLK